MALFNKKEKEESIQTIEITRIVANRYQPRTTFEIEALNELAESIELYGLIQPIVVRPAGEEMFEIVAGERRFRAAKIAGLDMIPVIIKDLEAKDSAILAVIENIQREDLNPIEEAKSYQRLAALLELTQDEVAKMVGKSQSAVANKMRLLQLPDDIQMALKDKSISERHARALLKFETDTARSVMLEQIIKEGLTVAETERIIDEKLNKVNGDNKEVKTKVRIKGYANDVRLAINTVKKSLKTIEKFGHKAEVTEEENDGFYEINIRIAKNEDKPTEAQPENHLFEPLTIAEATDEVLVIETAEGEIGSQIEEDTDLISSVENENLEMQTKEEAIQEAKSKPAVEENEFPGYVTGIFEKIENDSSNEFNENIIMEELLDDEIIIDLDTTEEQLADISLAIDEVDKNTGLDVNIDTIIENNINNEEIVLNDFTEMQINEELENKFSGLDISIFDNLTLEEDPNKVSIEDELNEVTSEVKDSELDVTNTFHFVYNANYGNDTHTPSSTESEDIFSSVTTDKLPEIEELLIVDVEEIEEENELFKTTELDLESTYSSIYESYYNGDKAEIPEEVLEAGEKYLSEDKKKEENSSMYSSIYDFGNTKEHKDEVLNWQTLLGDDTEAEPLPANDYQKDQANRVKALFDEVSGETTPSSEKSDRTELDDLITANQTDLLLQEQVANTNVENDANSEAVKYGAKQSFVDKLKNTNNTSNSFLFEDEEEDTTDKKKSGDSFWSIFK